MIPIASMFSADDLADLNSNIANNLIIVHNKSLVFLVYSTPEDSLEEATVKY